MSRSSPERGLLSRLLRLLGPPPPRRYFVNYRYYTIRYRAIALRYQTLAVRHRAP